MADADAVVVEAVLAGEVERFAELVDRYQDRALRLALGLLGHDEDARDAAQEAFIRAYRGLRRFRAGARFSTWFYRIVVNACYDAGRRRARTPAGTVRVGPGDADADTEGLFVDVADPGADPGELASQRELGIQMSQAIGELPMQQRSAFVLHHLEGLSLEDTAAAMGCRVGTVKAHVFRATQRLQERLAPWLAKEQHP